MMRGEMMHERFPGRFLFILIYVLIVTCAEQAKVIYVDDDAKIGGLGESWEEAVHSLDIAIEVSKDGDEIRMAQGVYKPRSRCTPK